MLDLPNHEGDKLEGYDTALPVDCKLENDVQALITVGLIPKLRAVMSKEEIGKASLGIQPHLNRMRQITCKGCAVLLCPHNFNSQAPGSFHTLFNGGAQQRREAGERLVHQLVPTELESQ